LNSGELILELFAALHPDEDGSPPPKCEIANRVTASVKLAANHPSAAAVGGARYISVIAHGRSLHSAERYSDPVPMVTRPATALVRNSVG
jgi:hypothetical protein